MFRRKPVVVLALLCGIAACQPAAVPTQVDTATDDAIAGPRPAAGGDAIPDAPVLSPAIEAARNRAHREDTLALADDVARLGDARALALAATLRNVGLWQADQAGGGRMAHEDPTVRRWLDESERQAPDDVTALVLSLGPVEHDRDRRSRLVARWRRLEPDNLVPIMHAALTEDALLEAAAGAKVFDNHHDDTIRAGIGILSRTSSPALARMRVSVDGMRPEAHDATLAVALWAATSLPALQKVSLPCRAADMDETRIRQCDHVARTLMRRSDLLIGEMLGASMIRRLPGATPEDLAEADAIDRERDWLTMRLGDLERGGSWNDMDHFVAVLRETQQLDERELYRRVLARAGVSPTPPAGWRKERDALSAGAVH